MEVILYIRYSCVPFFRVGYRAQWIILHVLIGSAGYCMCPYVHCLKFSLINEGRLIAIPQGCDPEVHVKGVSGTATGKSRLHIDFIN